MIYITKNQINNLYTTATENSTIPLSGITYLFHLYSHNTNENYYFNVTNSSSATSRYDLFIIDESTLDLTEGLYDYTIYESDTITVDPSGLNSIEKGLITVDDGINEITYITSQGGLNYKTI